VKNVLFVDDEKNVLDGLRRTLRPMHREWNMAFVGSGSEALDVMSGKPYEVVVSDMCMPGMNGADLLDKVRQRHPQTVRIILSGYADRDLILRSVKPAHQFLAKPCDAELVKAIVGRACAWRDMLTDASLKLLVTQTQTLPSLPSLYTELIEELQSPGACIKKAGEVISRDIGMTAKILKLVNSAFFGVRRTISNPVEAVSLLGLETLMSLALTIQIFSQLDQTEMYNFSPAALWSHSLRVGAFAKRIAQTEEIEPGVVTDSFTAGLLHDAGRLVLAANLPEQYGKMLDLAQAEKLAHIETERRIFGATHAEIGAYLLGLWGLPNSIVEAVAFHHRPDDCSDRSFCPLTAVHVGNALAHELHPPQNEYGAENLCLEYLSRLGLADRLPIWREACRTAEEKDC
jgi:HD-like signal output (HDOD) protein